MTEKTIEPVQIHDYLRQLLVENRKNPGRHRLALVIEGGACVALPPAQWLPL